MIRDAVADACVVTERARKLRAQYTLQAQNLRSRLEMRVNRVPQNLRRKTLQELMDEHAAKVKPAPPPPMPVLSHRTTMAESPRKSLKRLR